MTENDESYQEFSLGLNYLAYILKAVEDKVGEEVVRDFGKRYMDMQKEFHMGINIEDF